MDGFLATMMNHPTNCRRLRSRCFHSQSRRMTVLSVLLLLLAISSRPCLCQPYGSDDYDDYVKEVLNEDYRSDEDYEDPYMTDADDEKRQAKMKQQEDAAKEQARLEMERLAAQREAQFEAELNRMSQEKQKAAQKQKQQDAKMVARVLKADAKEDYYGVLGLYFWDLRIPPISLVSWIPSFNFLWKKKTKKKKDDKKDKDTTKATKHKFTKYLSFPGMDLFPMTPSKIKRAYRTRAMATHPDKNRDGRAHQAFVAVENAASILSDDKLRTEYNAQLRLKRQAQRQFVTDTFHKIVIDGFWKGTIQRTCVMLRIMLGPFALPALLLGSLIV